ncbi:MAG TPA: formimidoylglutamate deiminase [Marmoricola sp.]|nr:formimidoylglutamate deiminase [Marmoricola sp.]
MTEYLLEHAVIDGVVRDDVLVKVEDGRFSAVQPGGRGGRRVPGLTVPGLANCHSHAFHRALRGRTQAERGSFWTWRDQMYSVAEHLDPDSYRVLATAVFREMVATGITSVGEFHYLHHQPGGTPYDDPNAMGLALLAAADDAGIRIRLLDACYLSAGFGDDGMLSPEGVQRRYSDGDAEAWAARVAELPADRVGAAIHSVRAVPRDQLGTVARAAAGRPLHVHLSEQVLENEACLAATGRTPTELLDEAGVLGPRTSAVHATHLTEDDVRLLGDVECCACFCPTTERDLADGIGPSVQLARAGARLTLGSDSHAVVDLFEEMRAVEMHERLVTMQRGHWSAGELLAAATVDGHASLGFDDVGRIAVGQRADLVTLDLESPRTAGTGTSCETVVFAATSQDVRQVLVDGRVVFDGDTETVGRELAAAIRALGTEGPA